MGKIFSFLPSRLFQLPRIRRGVALEIAPHTKRGDRIGEMNGTLHHVVTVKIVASEAAEPKGLAYQRRVRNVERVVLHLELAVTVPAVFGLHRDTASGVLAMTACALLGCDRFASFGEARLVETKDGMPIERPVMTGVAVGVFHFSESEVGGGFAQAEKKASACLDLLAHGARSRSMAARTGKLSVPHVHPSWRREVLLTRREQPSPGRDLQAEP